MNETFERLISCYVQSGVGLVDGLLHEDLSAALKANLVRLLSQNQLKSAGIGSSSNLQTIKAIRSDQIYWLDRRHNDPYENKFFDLIDEFVAYLNRTCFAGITSYEFHYAFYDIGTAYKRHLDQFRDNQHRAFSMIMYLNKDWASGDGGELCIYHTDRTQVIEPIEGQCVFFKSSELEHEVLINLKPRMSITGWLKTG